MTTIFDLSGRTVLITGSSRGIGLSLADGLATAGATIVLNGTDLKRLEATRACLAQAHGTDRIHAVAFDITDEQAVRSAVTSIENSVGSIDVLINNAGVQHREPLVDVSVDEWRRVIDVDVTGAYSLSDALLRVA